MPRYVETYELIPRYSAGSPAMVHDQREVQRVIHHEKFMHEAATEGVFGPESQAKAERLGLRGIALKRISDDRFLDLITDTEMKDIPYAAIRHPEKLVVHRKGREESYFFRFERIALLPVSKTPDANMMKVSHLLAQLLGTDIFDATVSEMWRGRISN